MSIRWTLTVALLGCLMLSEPSGALAQFRPGGRRHQVPSAKPNTNVRRSVPGAVHQDRNRSSLPDSPSPEPTVDGLLRRALEQPDSNPSLLRLIQAASKRDGSLEPLMGSLKNLVSQGGNDAAAASVVMAGLFAQNGNPEQAELALESALHLTPDFLPALRRRYDLAGRTNNRPLALSAAERLSSLEHAPSARGFWLRELRSLAIDQRDWARMEKAQRQLLEQDGESWRLERELGQELLHRGQAEQAIPHLHDALTRSQSDAQARASLLRDLTEAYADLGQTELALETAKRALRAARGQPGMVADVQGLRAELYRKNHRLMELVLELEEENSQDLDRLRLRASLEEEVGRFERATADYRKVVGRNPRDLDARLALHRVLLTQGLVQAAERELEALFRLAPKRLDFGLRLAEAYAAHGNRSRAHQVLESLSRRIGAEPGEALSLSTAWQRLGEAERGLEVLRNASEGQEPSTEVVIEFGHRQFLANQTQNAVRTWNRLLEEGVRRGKSLIRVAQIHLDHGLLDSAFTMLEAADSLAPMDNEEIRLRAESYARLASLAAGARAETARFRSERAWDLLLTQKELSPTERREATQRLVLSWSLDGSLPSQIRKLSDRFAREPSNERLGCLLAIAARRAGMRSMAATTLETLLHHVPKSMDGWQAMEQLRVEERDYASATRAAEALLALDRGDSQDITRRLIEYSLLDSRPRDALRHARKATELSGNSPDVWARLARLERDNQDIPHAIDHLGRALELDPRRHDLALELAELLVARGEAGSAFSLLLSVLKESSDDRLWLRALHSSLPAARLTQQMELLEQSLHGLAARQPERQIVRDGLLELYASMASNWLNQRRAGDLADSAQASQALSQLGQRALTPLLRALNDNRESTQRTALDILSATQNADAGQALISFAEHTQDRSLAEKALALAGHLEDPRLVPRWLEMLERAHPNTGEMAIWALMRHRRHPDVRRALSQAARESTGTLQALAILAQEGSASPRMLDELHRLAAQSNTSLVSRAAAILVLSRTPPPGWAKALETWSYEAEPLLRLVVVAGLAQTRDPNVATYLARALVDAEPGHDLDVVRAMAPWIQIPSPDWDSTLADWDVSTGSNRLVFLLTQSAVTLENRAELFGKLADGLVKAATIEASSGSEGAQRIASLFLAQEPRLGFGDLTQGFDALPTPLKSRVDEGLRRLHVALSPVYQSLFEGDSLALRILALRVLVLDPSRAADPIRVALHDSNEHLRQTGMRLLQHTPFLELLPEVLECLSSDPSWAVRAEATTVLGRGLATPSREQILAALRRAMRKDSHAIVRIRALDSLARAKDVALRAELRYVTMHDEEPEVRRLARQLAPPSQ